MGLVDDFRSGNFTVYGQWTAILTIVLLIIIGIACFISTLIPFSILSFGFAGVMLLLEVPILTSCCPCAGPRTESFVKFFSNPIFKTCLYAVFAALIWVSLLVATSTMIISALALTTTCGLYGVAMFRKDTPSGSSVLGGASGAAAAAKGANKATNIIKKSASTGASAV